MRFFILFGLLAAVIGDLLFLNGQYTRAVGHWLGSFSFAMRNTSADLWGSN
ncbi:hypothetical protein [Sphingomonas sp.]|jgi:hypothetical protein|uniref:hypothetical protein n=1 Tax=Sphingomonas sp. TaxID=28214 RepID=UPI002E35E0A9|nr:hypothetical protein [Sphingomonas sp.]HEX4694784.1 hypothetical protein [Sphingomonas sp.]